MTALPPHYKRVIPFGVYLAFLIVESLLDGSSWLSSNSPPNAVLWLYPAKTLFVATVLVWFWRDYQELQWRSRDSVGAMTAAIVVGLGVYLLWVRMDWSWARQSEGTQSGYDPFGVGNDHAALLAGIRLFGAAVVVPIMEELFWRSFLIRYLISSKFQSVPLGTFTPLSFGATVLLFGLEHDLWLAGMMAGTAYNGLWYYTRSLWPCIIAHGVTNLTLGIHVLVTHEWKWW